jgi:hypothetical protein
MVCTNIARFALRHRGAITFVLLAAFVLNMLVVGRLDPPDPSQDTMPMVSRCQGGGPTCAEQPMIPPPVGGLPSFDAPADPVFGALVVVEPNALPAIHESPPRAIEHPPALRVA